MKFKILFFLVCFSVGILQSATLRWDANKEPDLSGYMVYCGSESGIYDYLVDVGNTNSWPIPPEIGRYYMVITAYDSTGNESGFSQEVFWAEISVIPNPFYNGIEIQAEGTMYISNILGQRIMKLEISGFQYVDLSHLPAGLYFFTCPGRTVRRIKL